MKHPLTDIALYYLSTVGEVKGLYRYAVKGLSGDELESVRLDVGDTFPDDRRFALLKKSKSSSFDPSNPVWLHKENFLCAFSAPELMAKYRATYRYSMTTDDDDDDGDGHDDMVNRQKKKLFNLFHQVDGEKVLKDINLSTLDGRQVLADFFSDLIGDESVLCVTADDVDVDDKKKNSPHRHQFGNTSSGWKQKQDTRTIHLVNTATVNGLSLAMDQPLRSTRFRPNLVIDGPDLKPWEEFNWIGKTIQCGSVQLEVLSRTVRCEGISIDPLDPIGTKALDIPSSLIEHFPEHGPYLGVYAVVSGGGTISLGDTVSLL